MLTASWIKHFWPSARAALTAVVAVWPSLGSTAESMRAAQVIVHKTDWAAVERHLEPGHSFALVIGISEFDRAPRLKGVADEVRDVTAALNAQGFDVTSPVTDGRMTKTQLAGAIRGFLARHGGSAENRLIIYVATHGYAASNRQDYGFLIASDSQPPGSNGFEATAYSVAELSRALTGISAQHVYLFFNSCFSGAMMPDPTRDARPLDDAVRRARALAPEVERWMVDLLVHNARLVLTAGSDKQTVPDVGNPFARSFVDEVCRARPTQTATASSSVSNSRSTCADAWPGRHASAAIRTTPFSPSCPS
jgi:hypothetical protein